MKGSPPLRAFETRVCRGPNADNYTIATEDLTALRTCIERLRVLVEQACQEHVERLGEAADS